MSSFEKSYERALAAASPSEKQFQKILRHLRDQMLERMRQGGHTFKGKLVEPTPWDINNGRCEEFMWAVIEQVPEADEADLSDYGLAHTAVEWKGKFYDAEATSGVKDPRELPIARNRGLSREEAIKRMGYLKGKRQ